MYKKQLIDKFQRQIKYLRLSVTDRCDFRCFYCIPKGFHDFQEPEQWLTFQEIEQLVRVFAQLGVKRLRLTGGEPLVRKNVVDLVRRLSNISGLDDISLSTNASQLSKYAKMLAKSGIARINVSLDSLQPERFKKITNGSLDKVLAGLMAAKKANISPIKINMVVMKGINDDEVEDMVHFCIEQDFTLRFIETMPMGNSGLQAENNHYMSLQLIRQHLQQRFDLVPSIMSGGGPAHYLKIAGSNTDIGFITPISQHFCETCNRVRISVDGNLYLCLGDAHQVALRPLLRTGISDKDLAAVLLEAINLKPFKHEFVENPEKVIRVMSVTGG